MIDVLSCASVHRQLTDNGFDFFAGVPDSLLKNFCAYVSENTRADRHVIAANEGAAVALAAGSYLASGRVGVVYMQNSGLGNAVNPLVSLAAPSVYGVPMLLVIGWRGEPGTKDEPQHVHQGRVTPDMLEALRIGYTELPTNSDEAERCLWKAMNLALDAAAPYALLVRKGTFEPHFPVAAALDEAAPMTREAALTWALAAIDERAVVVATTGYTSRELWEHRRKRGEDDRADFLTVGSMGHASQVAMGVALRRPSRSVYCLDGDGAMIMHMGALAVIGSSGLKNLKHVVLNNGVHDSVGGQPTVCRDIDVPAIARACGYGFAATTDSLAGLAEVFPPFRASKGPCLLEIRIRPGARPDLGRPTIDPQSQKTRVMELLAC